MVNKIARPLMEALFPYLCVLCRLPSGRPLPLCRNCQEELPHNHHPCSMCALPLPQGQSLCGQCIKRAPTYRICIAPLLYASPVAEFVQNLKYRRDMTMLPLLGQLMAEAVQPYLENNSRPDCLLPMPLHWSRLWRRGFNQTERLAYSLARHPYMQAYALKLDRSLCRRIRATAPQQGLDRTARQRNLLGAFRPSPGVEGLHIVVIDDVVTTGASVEILAQALVDAGARQVDVWCCARTPDSQPGEMLYTSSR